MSTVGIPCAAAGHAAQATTAIVSPAQAVRATNLLCRPITFLHWLKSVVRAASRSPSLGVVQPTTSGSPADGEQARNNGSSSSASAASYRCPVYLQLLPNSLQRRELSRRPTTGLTHHSERRARVASAGERG